MKKLWLISAGVLVLMASAAFAKTKPAVVQEVTHFLSYDLTKNKVVPYNGKNDQQIFVFGLDGTIEPGVVVAQSKDGTKVLVAPPEIAGPMLGIEPEAPHAPQSEAENKQ